MTEPLPLIRCLACGRAYRPGSQTEQCTHQWTAGWYAERLYEAETAMWLIQGQIRYPESAEALVSRTIDHYRAAKEVATRMALAGTDRHESEGGGTYPENGFFPEEV